MHQCYKIILKLIKKIKKYHLKKIQQKLKVKDIIMNNLQQKYYKNKCKHI